MTAPIRQLLWQTFLFIVQFSNRYLKAPSCSFLMKNKLQTDAFVAFVKSFSSVSSTSSLSTMTWQRSLQQGFWLTLLLCLRGSLNRISNDFCYTELKFLRNSESDRTLISFRTSRSEYLEKLFLEILRKKFPGRELL